MAQITWKNINVNHVLIAEEESVVITVRDMMNGFGITGDTSIVK